MENKRLQKSERKTPPIHYYYFYFFCLFKVIFLSKSTIVVPPSVLIILPIFFSNMQKYIFFIPIYLFFQTKSLHPPFWDRVINGRPSNVEPFVCFRIIFFSDILLTFFCRLFCLFLSFTKTLLPGRLKVLWDFYFFHFFILKTSKVRGLTLRYFWGITYGKANIEQQYFCRYR